MNNKHITIKDVAREAGVALGTVSNVVNHPEKVRPETLELVQEVIDRLGYAPDQSARMLAGGHTPLIALLVPNFEHGISLQIVNGARTEAKKHGYGLIIAHMDANVDQGSWYVRYFAGIHVAGMLVQPVSSQAIPSSALAGPTPTVWLNCQSDKAGYFVDVDEQAQGSLMAEHALSCGCTRIVVAGAEESPEIERRLAGIKDIMRHQPDISCEILKDVPVHSPKDGYALGAELAKRPESKRPDFVLALTDVLATGIVAGIRSAGLDVPDDIRVAGCDGNPLAWNGAVPLTTIAPAGYEIGRKGVQMLLKHLGKDNAGFPATPAENHQELVRPFLIARASTGAEGSLDFADPALDIRGYL